MATLLEGSMQLGRRMWNGINSNLDKAAMKVNGTTPFADTRKSVRGGAEAKALDRAETFDYARENVDDIRTIQKIAKENDAKFSEAADSHFKTKYGDNLDEEAQRRLDMTKKAADNSKIMNQINNKDLSKEALDDNLRKMAKDGGKTKATDIVGTYLSGSDIKGKEDRVKQMAFRYGALAGAAATPAAAIDMVGDVPSMIVGNRGLVKDSDGSFDVAFVPFL